MMAIEWHEKRRRNNGRWLLENSDVGLMNKLRWSLNTIGTRVEQGICYVLDQTDKVSSPTGLSIYTQGKHGYTLWLCYESILLLVNIHLLIMMQYHAILMWLDRYSNTPPRAKHSWVMRSYWWMRVDDACPEWIAPFASSTPWHQQLMRCMLRMIEMNGYSILDSPKNR